MHEGSRGQMRKETADEDWGRGKHIALRKLGRKRAEENRRGQKRDAIEQRRADEGTTGETLKPKCLRNPRDTKHYFSGHHSVTRVLTRALLGGTLPPPCGFSRIAKKRTARSTAVFCIPYRHTFLHPHHFRTFTENFVPRSSQARSPG